MGRTGSRTASSTARSCVRNAIRRLALATVAAAVVVAAFPLFLELRSMGTKKFEPQPFDFVLLAASVFAMALGAQIVPLRTARYLTLVASLASGSLLFGFLAIFSIGLAFLPAGIVLLLLLYRALRRSPLSASAARAALGGASIGFALPMLYIALIVPATVECFPNGGGTSGGRWHSASQVFSTSGSVSVDRDSVVTGRMESTDSVVTYRCEGGRLVEFQRVPR